MSIAAELLPLLGTKIEYGFNVFDVMHHGMHEKQLSNVFAWLLDSQGSHQLGDRFVKIFVDVVAAQSKLTFPTTGYTVAQEVNTSLPGMPEDIADIVLSQPGFAIVVENYYTSDGHGHDYWGYLRFGQTAPSSAARSCHNARIAASRQAAVVMLCQSAGNMTALTRGWQQSVLIPYAAVLRPLADQVSADLRYQQANPDAYWFIRQIHDKFAKKGAPMGTAETVKFLAAMCTTGQAQHYQQIDQAQAADQFSQAVQLDAKMQYSQGLETLQLIKRALKSYCVGTLPTQVNARLADHSGGDFVREVSAGYRGIYQWTINFEIPEESSSGEAALQIKFGPSAWFANEQDKYWIGGNAPIVQNPDYTRLFVTRRSRSEIKQTPVSLEQVLAGLAPDDQRLADSIVALFPDFAR